MGSARAAYDEARGGPGAFAGLTSSALKDTHLSLNGHVMLGALKLTAGLVRRDNGGNKVSPKGDLWFTGAQYPLAPLVLAEIEFFDLRYMPGGDKAALAAARLTYTLSRRTAAYTTFGRINNGGKLALSVSAGAAGGNPVAGASQNVIAVGLRHLF